MVPFRDVFLKKYTAGDRQRRPLQRDQLRRLVPELQERRPPEDRRLRHLRDGRQLGAGVRSLRDHPEHGQAGPEGQPGHPPEGPRTGLLAAQVGAAAEGVRRATRPSCTRWSSSTTSRCSTTTRTTSTSAPEDLGRHLPRSPRPPSSRSTAGRHAASPATRSCRPTCRCSTPTAATSSTTTGRRASPGRRAWRRWSGCSRSFPTCRPVLPPSTPTRRRHCSCKATRRP